MMPLRRVIILVVLLFIAAVVAEDCSNQNCTIPKHYYEIGCTPIPEEGSCCPSRFDCNSLSGRNSSKCYYKGQAYDVNTELTQDPSSPCSVHCRCNSVSGRAQLTCINVECPELFQGPLADPNCFRQYSFDKCCSTNTHCSNKTEKQPTSPAPLAECQYDGKTYKEGQVIYPDDAPCKKCICQAGFNGTLDGPWCQDISCGIELHYSRQISDGCIPVYYGNSGCCPIDWRCPAGSDSVIASEVVISKNAEHKCKFGNLELKIGDKLSAISNKCIECSCLVPPLVSCTQKTYNECTN